MARTARPNDADGPKVTNLSEVKDLIRNAIPEIINIDKDIKAKRDRRNELRSAIEAAGVPKKAFDYALKVRNMEPEDRQGFDEGYVIAREAIGLGVQRGLFEALESDEVEPEPEAKTQVSDGKGGAKAAGAKAAAKPAAKPKAAPEAAPPADDADLAGDEWIVVDQAAGADGETLYLMPDKLSWSDKVEEAGRWGPDRAAQLGAEQEADAIRAPAEAAIV